MDAMQASCGYCCRKDTNVRRCSRCWSVYYCSKACQAMDWPGHKFSCVTPSEITKKTTTQKFKSTLNETLSEIEEIGIKNQTNTSEALDTEIDTVSAHSNSCPDNLLHRTEIDPRNVEAKMKVEYSNFEPNKKDDLKIIGTESEKGEDPNRAEENCSMGDSGFSDIEKEKDRNPPKCQPDRGDGEMSGSDECSTCSTPGCSRKCSRCKEAFYCSQKCQKKDWSTHKLTCKKKLAEEEEKIKTLHEKMTKDTERLKSSLEEKDGRRVTVFPTFQGPPERFFEMLTLEQALHRATRPSGSLQRAIRLARIFYPCHDIVTKFDDIPRESVFPFFPFMFPPRGGYVLVAFMYRYHEHVMRHGAYLKDAQDKESKVEFYLDHVGDNPFPFFTYSQVKPGGYICLVDPVMHLFGDGSVGIRINNPDEVKILDIEMVMK